jgi:membrane-associated phospholipid phosphatase
MKHYVVHLKRAAVAMACAASLHGPSAQAQSLPQSTAIAPPASQFSSAVVYDWFELILRLVPQTPDYSPPVTARAMAAISLTLYESVVPGMPGYQSLAGQLNELSSLPAVQPDEPLHWPTVAHAALGAMTSMTLGRSSGNQQAIEQLRRSLPLKYPKDFDPNTITAEISNRSETRGKLMAMALETWLRTDGSQQPRNLGVLGLAKYLPPTGEGKWSPTPSNFAPALLPYWGDNRPMVLQRAADCPAPAPLAYAEGVGSAFYKQAKEVYDISNASTPEQRQYALYWADDAGKTATPAGHWAFIANDLLKLRKADLGAAALVMAKLNIAMSDSMVAAWHTKYTLNVLRPVTYVQVGIDSQWIPWITVTPPFPDYPSGHSVLSAAASTVLTHELGANTEFTDNTHNDRGWGPRKFKSFQAAADEAALSRLYAGIHYRFAVEGGKPQGRCVGEKVLALKFKP